MYKGIFFTFIASLIWGIVQPLFFNYINHLHPIEIVSHRALWSFVLLLFIVFFLGKIKVAYKILRNKNTLFCLLITGSLVSCNWTGFIIAVNLERVQDASLGYYISPIISIVLGYFFLKESLSFYKIVSILLMLLAIILLLYNYNSIPFLAIFIGLTWALYGLIKKQLSIDAEIGLLFETGIISCIALPYLIFLHLNGFGHYLISSNYDTILLMLTGLITIIPLFFFNLGVKYLPLSFAGVVFFATPTFHFLTSILILNEKINNIKLISFIIIWLAVILFIKEKFKEERLSRIILNN